jgi:hypothetical protein
MSSMITLHPSNNQEEVETVDAPLALQLYHAPSPTTTTINLTDDEWSSSATTDDSLADFFKQIPDHPGEGWVPNDVHSPYYYHFELPTMYRGVVAKYVCYDLSPAYPLVLGTLGKGHPIHSHLL